MPVATNRRVSWQAVAPERCSTMPVRVSSPITGRLRGKAWNPAYLVTLSRIACAATRRLPLGSTRTVRTGKGMIFKRRTPGCASCVTAVRFQKGGRIKRALCERLGVLVTRVESKKMRVILKVSSRQYYSRFPGLTGYFGEARAPVFLSGFGSTFTAGCAACGRVRPKSWARLVDTDWEQYK